MRRCSQGLSIAALYHSAEIRWFLPDQGHWDRLFAWFMLPGQLPLIVEDENYIKKDLSKPFVKEEKPRTDAYLLFPDCEALGVKRRQGRLEVKALVAGPRPFSLGAVAGRMDQWVKWSFAPSESIRAQLGIELDQSGEWCEVEKIRYLQKYSFDAGSWIAVSPEQYPDAGCSIELTKVKVLPGAGRWLTFGFEAFGPAGQIIAILDEAVQNFFAGHGPPPVQLDGRNSLSYPAWLAMLQ